MSGTYKELSPLILRHPSIMSLSLWYNCDCWSRNCLPLCSLNSVTHIKCLAFDWQYMCYIWWTCFLTNSSHTHVYQLSSSSCQLVSLVVWDRPCHSIFRFMCNVLYIIVCFLSNFCFGHWALCPFLVYGFWLHFWNRHILLEVISHNNI
jgi:hypothetical protein